MATSTQLLYKLLSTNSSEIYLRAGAMNQYVSALQQLLHQAGFDRELKWNIYGADGYYGENVINAVRAYGARRGVSTNGMSVAALLLSQMLQQNSSSSGSAWSPKPEQPPAPAKPASLQISDQGDRVAVSDGRRQATFLKRDAGLAFYGSQTIEQAVSEHRSLLQSLGITPSAINVMRSVAENEGKLDSVNTYDRAFLSFGIFQWTLGTDSYGGELAALLKKFKQQYPADYQHYFGVYGLDVTADTSETSGFFTLHGNRIDTPNEKEQFRRPEWAFRFWLAGQDPKLQGIEILHALARLKSFYWNPKFGINNFRLAEIITSEYGVALLLDHHVNRPSFVQPSVQIAMRQTGLTNPTFWTSLDERRLIDAYLNVRATYTSGTASPMTKAHERAAITRRYLDRGVISAERYSFHYSREMVS